MEFFIFYMIAGLAVPVFIIYLIVRGVSAITHRGTVQSNHITPEQLKRVACGTIIVALVPAFLYQLMDVLTLVPSKNLYGYGLADPYATVGVIIGAGFALMLGLAFHANKVVSYGLTVGGVLTLFSEFITNFENIAAPIRVVAIGVLLIALIAYAVKKTMKHEHNVNTGQEA